MQVPHDATYDEYILSCVRKYQEKLTVCNKNFTVSLGYLADNLDSFAKEMAHEIHDAWVAKKYLDGFRYAVVRDDKLKLHDQMKPAHLLTETQLSWDIATAEETIRQLIKALDK